MYDITFADSVNGIYLFFLNATIIMFHLNGDDHFYDLVGYSYTFFHEAVWI